jgi:two-component system sensor histidine kinase TorS
MSSPLSLLLVEDDQVFADLLIAVAGSAGFEVEHADSVRAAVACIDARAFDVFLLDFNLPDGNARDILAYIDASPQAGAAVLVVSAEPRVDELLPPGTRFMSKPLHARGLRDQLAALVLAALPPPAPTHLPPP